MKIKLNTLQIASLISKYKNSYEDLREKQKIEWMRTHYKYVGILFWKRERTESELIDTWNRIQSQQLSFGKELELAMFKTRNDHHLNTIYRIESVTRKIDDPSKEIELNEYEFLTITGHYINNEHK